MGMYVLDFYCPALKLAIEIDGDSHLKPGANERDADRQAFVESFGIRFLRFTNDQVYLNLEGVLETIAGVARLGNERKKSPPYEGGDKGEVSTWRG